MVMTITNFTLDQLILFAQALILIVGLGLTSWSIRNNRLDNKRRATVDLILHQRSNQSLNDAVDLVAELVGQEEFPDLSKYLNKKTYPKERKAILDVLNYREFVAVGINTDIIDEEIYKRAFYNIIIRDWKNLDKTIHSIRCSSKGSKTNFQDFECLVKRWEHEPLCINSK